MCMFSSTPCHTGTVLKGDTGGRLCRDAAGEQGGRRPHQRRRCGQRAANQQLYARRSAHPRGQPAPERAGHRAADARLAPAARGCRPPHVPRPLHTFFRVHCNHSSIVCPPCCVPCGQVGGQCRASRSTRGMSSRGSKHRLSLQACMSACAVCCRSGQAPDRALYLRVRRRRGLGPAGAAAGAGAAVL